MSPLQPANTYNWFTHTHWSPSRGSWSSCYVYTEKHSLTFLNIGCSESFISFVLHFSNTWPTCDVLQPQTHITRHGCGLHLLRNMYWCNYSYWCESDLSATEVKPERRTWDKNNTRAALKPTITGSYRCFRLHLMEDFRWDVVLLLLIMILHLSWV